MRLQNNNHIFIETLLNIAFTLNVNLVLHTRLYNFM